jgi:hypothetical protein
MRVLQLSDGNLLIPLLMPDPEDGIALIAIGPDHLDCGSWLVLAAPGEDLRPREEPPI